MNSRPTVSVSQVGDQLVSTSGDAYQWLSSDGKNITDATSQRFVPLTEGKYAVRLTLNGCSATSAYVMYKKQDNQSMIIVFDLIFGGIFVGLEELNSILVSFISYLFLHGFRCNS